MDLNNGQIYAQAIIFPVLALIFHNPFDILPYKKKRKEAKPYLKGLSFLIEQLLTNHGGLNNVETAMKSLLIPLIYP